MRGEGQPADTATTAATRPEASSASAGTIATKGTAKESAVVAVGEEKRPRIHRFNLPTIKPITAATSTDDERVIKDSNGNVLQDGDTVTVIKDLKLKGSSLVVKVGTKVKNIRLVDGDHDIDCKIDGIGAMSLKSEFVKKV